MNLKENVFSFLASSLLAFLADYLGLGRITRQTLSSVVVRHLLPPPPPAYTISYREPPPNPPEFTQATQDTQDIPDSYSTDSDEEPFVYSSSYFYTTWTPPDSPTHAFTQYIILGLEIAIFFCLIRLFWSLAASLFKTRRAVQPQKTLLDLAFSEIDEITADDDTPATYTARLTSFLSAGNFLVHRLISLTIDCFLCLQASYPYVIGFPRRAITDRHFYPTVDLATPRFAVTIDADEQGDQPEDDSVGSGNTSVISAVSTAVGEPEGEEGGSSPALNPQEEHPQVITDIGTFVEGAVREDNDTPDFIVVQFDLDDPPVLFRSRHLAESSPPRSPMAQETQNSTAIVQQNHRILSTASPLALRSERSVRFELGEPFARPRTRLTTGPCLATDDNMSAALESSGSDADLASEVDINASIVIGPSACASSPANDTSLALTGSVGRQELRESSGIVNMSSEAEDRITTPGMIGPRAPIDDPRACEEQSLMEISTSFVRYEHGSPLSAIEELSQENISPPRSPMTDTDRRALLASPCTDPGSPQLVTPCDFGIVLPANPDQSIPVEEVFNSATLPTDFPLISKDAGIAGAIDEDIDDWDWTLLNVALHDQRCIVRATPQTVVGPSVIPSLEDDPFVVSPSAIPSERGLSTSPAFQTTQDDVTDHQRARSDPIRQRVAECSWITSITADAAPYSLTPDQAEIFSTVCGIYGLILPDSSVRAYYHRASWDFIFEEEKRCLKLAAKRPNERKRRRSSLAPVPKTPKLPRGYGLSRANFLGFYNAMLFTPEKTYANVSRRGVSPSPTRSPATTSVSPISVPGSFEPIRTHGRTQSMINLNRSRGGSNIAMNGVALRAQLPPPNLKTRRSFDRSTTRPSLHPILFPGREYQEAAEAGRGRSPSASPTIPHSVWVREMVQENQDGPSSKPTYSTHRRCASQSAVIGESSASFASVRAGTSPGQRGRPLYNRARLPEHGELVSSTSTQTAQSPSAVSTTSKGKGKGKEAQTSVPVVEPSTRNPPRPPAFSRLTRPSAPSLQLGQKAPGRMQATALMSAYPRIDDDGAVSRFEEEQGLV